jgi:hypothetical protein
MASAFGGSVPHDVLIWDIVEATGWTMEYIYSLPLETIYQWMSIRDGRSKAAGRKGKKNG